MKLNKKITALKAATLVSSLLLTGIGFSAPIDKEAISMRCEMVYNTLDKLSEGNLSKPCALSVQYAGWVMQVAANLVRTERYPLALKNLRIVEGNLKEVHSKTQDCAYFSAKVVPSLNEVNGLITELETTPN
ncbi:hypothetical protein SAMN02746093_02882 [Legionella quinlivanii DSM 21216]|uniref:hypothetical protein n=1 Tax=Legionella quinlivanii TaxID=45073 RepID=UPI00089E3CA9|nr:hypothetical protein [Legionella quinlivanii]SEG42081.1 hypothetical protein SAMN02746093_02882 [Legionella quinlivanii DSM 21216]